MTLSRSGVAAALLLLAAASGGQVLDVPADVYTPSELLARPPGLQLFPDVPAIAIVAPNQTGFPSQAWRGNVTTNVFGALSNLVTDPIELLFGGVQEASLPVGNFYGAPDLTGGALKFANQTSAALPDFFAEYRADELDEIDASLTDPDAAEAHLWALLSRPASGGQPFNLFTFVKALDPEGLAGVLPALAEVDGDGSVVTAALTARLTRLARKGKLFVVDASASAGVTPRQGASAPIYTLGATLLFKQLGKDKRLKPVAIRLQQSQGSGSEVQTYTRDSCATGSAWAQAIYHSLVGINTLGTWTGHVLNWHLTPAALTWTMINSLEPGHPLRTLLDPRLDSNLQFLTSLLAPEPVLAATPTPVTLFPEIMALNQAYVEQRQTSLKFPEDYEPVRHAQANGLGASSFGTNYDAFPMIGLQQRLWEIAEDYARRVVHAIYPSGKAVRQDVQLAAWMEAAADPARGNVAGLEPPRNKKALISLITFLAYTPLTHTLTNLLSANVNVFNSRTFPASVLTPDLPDPAATYDDAGLLAGAVLPDAWAYQRYVRFYGTFMLSPANDRLIPESGNLREDLYFPSLPARHPVNVAQIRVRRKMLRVLDDFLDDFNPGFCEAYAEYGLGDEEACRDWQIGQLSKATAW